MAPEYQSARQWDYPFVGRWGITALPEGWMLVPKFGIRQIGDNQQFILANVGLTYDPLPQGKTLTEYIEKQRGMIAGTYNAAKFAGPQPVEFPGAEETYMLLIRHPSDQGVEMLHVQHYVRAGDWIGIITFTVPEPSLRALRPDHEMFMKGLHILPEEPPEPEFEVSQYQ